MVTFRITGLEQVIDKINSVDLDELCYIIHNNLRADIAKRVFVDGKASDGSQIGTYSPAYMKVRTGNYAETKLKSGKNKGNFKEKKSAGQAGVFTKGKNKGQKRPVYNHLNDTKVVLVLTGAMEEDFKGTPPKKIPNGYGIHIYQDAQNYRKHCNFKG